MIETRISRRIDNAHLLAHEERGKAFAAFFRAVPKIVSSLRHRS